MNLTRIEWCRYSWNPITGCLHGCWYCYAKKLAMRFPKVFPNGFEPTFYEDRLKEPWEVKKPSKIFVCSIADLYAPWTPSEWREAVLVSMLQCPVKHIFQMLTKNPERIPKGPVYPNNWWFGATVTGRSDQHFIDIIKHVNSGIRFISFEPLLYAINFSTYCLKGIDWVIVGKLTGSKKVKLNIAWVKAIEIECDKHNIPIFMKNNLGIESPRQEFPNHAELHETR